MASPAAATKLREIQSVPGNKVCVDCSQRNPQWASVSLGAFMCLECSGKHRGLGVHISFVRSVTMDSWSDLQLRKMEVGGNDALNAFFLQYGIPKETDIVAKYNSRAAEVYRGKIAAVAGGGAWTAPPVERAALPLASGRPKVQAASGPGGFGRADAWDDWGDGGADRGPGGATAGGMKRNNSSGSMHTSVAAPSLGPRTGSAGDLYSRSQLEASAARKDDFFARKQAENAARPEGLKPSQGGKYVGFGSAPAKPPASAGSVIGGNALNDSMGSLSQGFSRLSAVAASAAQSAAVAVQASTRDIQAKVKEGGYDQQAREAASVVAARGAEVSQKAWGYMTRIAALASQTVESYTKDPRDEGHLAGSGRRNGYEEYGETPQDDDEEALVGGGGSAGEVSQRTADSWGQSKPRNSSFGTAAAPARTAAAAAAGDDDWDAWGASGRKEESNGYGGSRGDHGQAQGSGRLNKKGSARQVDAAPGVPSGRQVAAPSDGAWAGWDDVDEDEHAGGGAHGRPGQAAGGGESPTDWDDWGDSDAKWSGKTT